MLLSKTDVMFFWQTNAQNMSHSDTKNYITVSDK